MTSGLTRSSSTRTWLTSDYWVPVALVVVFSAVVTGWFNLSEGMPVPLAVLAGAAWGLILGVLGVRIGRSAVGAWLEDGFVSMGAIAFAFAGCGGIMALLLLNGALDSPSLTGETLESVFLPSIPYYITVNGVLELLLVPGALALGWRPGLRRTLILATATLYFTTRVWTYLTFVPSRLGWAESEHGTQPLTATERQQAAQDLMLDDLRWIPLLVMLAIFLVAAHLSRVREQRAAHRPR